MDLSPGTTVKVINKGNRPFSIGYDGRTYPLTPSKPSFVPAEAAILWFGDPRSTDSTASFKNPSGVVTVIPDRASEVRRLCVKYGYVSGGELEFLTKEGIHSDNNVPKVEVWGTGEDEDESLPIVLNDPEGSSVTPVTVTAADQSDLIALVKAQSQQILALQQHLGLTNTTELNEGAELPEDDSHLQGEKDSTTFLGLDLE